MLGSRRHTGRRLHVLGWHNVESTWRYPSAPGTGALRLERQFRALKRAANVVPLDDALEDLRAGRPLPPRAVAITFDDGYRDNLTVAVPMLNRLGLPATIFLVPGLLSRRTSAWWERLAWAIFRARSPALTLNGRSVPTDSPAARQEALTLVEHMVKALNDADRHAIVDRVSDELDPAGDDPTDDLFMDWDEARQLVRSGVEIGSHTVTHVVLGNEDDDTVRAELVDSRASLRERLEVEIDTLAYPNGQPGDYDDRVVGAARDAGYRGAVAGWGLVSTPDTPHYEVRRKLVSPLLPTSRLVLSMARDSRGGH